jgi:diacylglycerol O-acyltransferase / wax synthase
MSRSFWEPLSPSDAWFLYAERPETPLDIGTVYIFEGGSRVAGGRGALGIRDTVAERLHLVPRYRQKIHPIRFHLGHPVWVDDPDFDLDLHIRQEALPAPGDGPSFRAAVARILSRPLDMRRPLWDMTIVTGLGAGRVGVVNRAHHAMLDGVSAADIITVLLDLAPEGVPVAPPAEPWVPRPAPSEWELVKPVLWNPPARRDPEGRSIRRRMGFWRLPVGGFASLARSQMRSRSDLFFNRKLGLQRSGRGLKVPLADVKAIKDRFGCTVNDAVLGLIAEGLHRWFEGRGSGVPDHVRVFCPVSVRADFEHGQMGNKVSGMVLEMPTAAMSMEERLRRIHQETAELKKSHQAVAAEKITGLAGWAPPTLLILAGRVMPNQQGGANINVTNVPGPQVPLYTGGAEMLEVWPFAPLYPSMGLGIAVVSYNGNLYLGFSADSTLVPDVEVLSLQIRAAAGEYAALAVAGGQ